MEKKEKWNKDWRVLERQAISTVETLQNIEKLTSSSVDLNINIINKYNYKLPRWKDLTQVSKLACMFRFIISSDRYYAFTLRLSRDKMSKAIETGKVSDYVRRIISVNLKNKLGYLPSFMFGIHYDNELEFHIHGVIEVKNNIKDIRIALKVSGFGKVYNKLKIHRNIAHFRILYLPQGWLRYILKYKIYDNIYISSDMTRELKSFYSNMYSKLEKKNRKSMGL